MITPFLPLDECERKLAQASDFLEEQLRNKDDYPVEARKQTMRDVQVLTRERDLTLAVTEILGHPGFADALRIVEHQRSHVVGIIGGSPNAGTYLSQFDRAIEALSALPMPDELS